MGRHRRPRPRRARAPSSRRARHVGFGTPASIGAFMVTAPLPCHGALLTDSHYSAHALTRSASSSLAWRSHTAPLPRSSSGKLHALGWVWRDCKPANLIVSNEGALRPIDLRARCARDGPSTRPWARLASRHPSGASPAVPTYQKTLFALGARIPPTLHVMAHASK